jgi:hypothetical protein
MNIVAWLLILSGDLELLGYLNIYKHLLFFSFSVFNADDFVSASSLLTESSGSQT